MNRVFERRRRRLVEEAKDRLEGRPIDEQVAVLGDLLDSQGFLADSDALSNTPRRYPRTSARPSSAGQNSPEPPTCSWTTPTASRGSSVSLL